MEVFGQIFKLVELTFIPSLRMQHSLLTLYVIFIFNFIFSGSRVFNMNINFLKII